MLTPLLLLSVAFKLIEGGQSTSNNDFVGGFVRVKLTRVYSMIRYIVMLPQCLSSCLVYFEVQPFLPKSSPTPSQKKAPRGIRNEHGGEYGP